MEVQVRVANNPDLDPLVLCNLIRGLRGPHSQQSLITQVQGRPLSPRLVRNIILNNPTVDPDLLQELINCLALTMERRNNFDYFQQLLHEEQ